MNYSITEVHESLFLLVIVDVPQEVIQSVVSAVRKNGSICSEKTNSHASSYIYNIYEVYGKNIEESLTIITVMLDELML